MPGEEGASWGLSSSDVRTACFSVQSEHNCRVRFEIVPSYTPKRGALYVRCVAVVTGEGGEEVERRWRGAYFPCNDCKTLTGLFHALLLGLDYDLTSLEAAEQAREQRSLFSLG